MLHLSLYTYISPELVHIIKYIKMAGNESNEGKKTSPKYPKIGLKQVLNDRSKYLPMIIKREGKSDLIALALIYPRSIFVDNKDLKSVYTVIDLDGCALDSRLNDILLKRSSKSKVTFSMEDNISYLLSEHDIKMSGFFVYDTQNGMAHADAVHLEYDEIDEVKKDKHSYSTMYM